MMIILLTNRIMKKITSLMTLLLVALATTADPISSATARQIAQCFLKAHGSQLKSEVLRARGQRIVPATITDEDIRTSQSPDEEEASVYYVFNATASKGFVIVSGDDCVGDNLVLGYASQGSFDADDVPMNMQSWLNDMGKQIAELSRLNVRAKTIAIHEDIDTLLTSLWDQGKNNYDSTNPYNRFCPETDGLLCVTGCMATALAQVMYYYRWPQALTEPLPSYQMKSGGVIDELPAVTFDWDNMLDTYHQETTDEQQTAVATLMRYCGQTVQMDYTPVVSNGMIYDLDMLVTKFGYDQDVYLARANSYTPSGWDELLYNELRDGRPLLYTAFSTGGGHAFVIDGYQAKDGIGYFHVNWGWDGTVNGYFRINVLQPSDSGTGASSTSDGYNTEQRALIGLQPATKPLENYGRYLSDLGWNTVDNFQYNLMIPINSSYKPGTFSIALAERDADGNIDYERLYNEQEMEFKGFSYATLEGYKAISLPDITVEGLEPGSHNLVFVNKESGTDAPWKTLFGPSSYIEVNVGEDGQTTEMLIHPMAKLTSSSRYFRIDGLRQWGVRHNVSATITNSGEDFVGSVDCTVYYMDDNNVLRYCAHSSMTGCMIESGGSCEVNFAPSFSQAGKYVVLLTKQGETRDLTGSKLSDIKNTNGYIVHKAVNIDELAFTCTGLSYEEWEYGAYFELELNNRTSMDYKGGLLAYLYRLNDEQFYEQVLFPRSSYISTIFELNSNSAHSVFLYLPEALEPGQYYLQLLIANDFHSMYLNDYFVFSGAPFTIDDTVDIANIENEKVNIGNEVYDLQGRRLPEQESSIPKKGLYIKNGKKFVVR